MLERLNELQQKLEEKERRTKLEQDALNDWIEKKEAKLSKSRSTFLKLSEQLKAEETQFNVTVETMNKQKKKIASSNDIFVDLTTQIALADAEASFLQNKKGSRSDHLHEKERKHVKHERMVLQDELKCYKESRENLHELHAQFVKDRDIASTQVMRMANFCEEAQAKLCGIVETPSASLNPHHKRNMHDCIDTLTDRILLCRHELQGYCANKLLMFQRNKRTAEDIYDKEPHSGGESIEVSAGHFIEKKTDFECMDKLISSCCVPVGASNNGTAISPTSNGSPTNQTTVTETNTLAPTSQKTASNVPLPLTGNDKGTVVITARERRKRRGKPEDSKGNMFTIQDDNTDNLTPFATEVCCLEGQLERHLQLKKALEAHIVFQSSILMLAQNSLTEVDITAPPEPEVVPVNDLKMGRVFKAKSNKVALGTTKPNNKSFIPSVRQHSHNEADIQEKHLERHTLSYAVKLFEQSQRLEQGTGNIASRLEEEFTDFMKSDPNETKVVHTSTAHMPESTTDPRLLSTGGGGGDKIHAGRMKMTLGTAEDIDNHFTDNTANTPVKNSANGSSMTTGNRPPSKSMDSTEQFKRKYATGISMGTNMGNLLNKNVGMQEQSIKTLEHRSERDKALSSLINHSHSNESAPSSPRAHRDIDSSELPSGVRFREILQQIITMEVRSCRLDDDDTQPGQKDKMNLEMALAKLASVSDASYQYHQDETAPAVVGMNKVGGKGPYKNEVGHRLSIQMLSQL